MTSEPTVHCGEDRGGENEGRKEAKSRARVLSAIWRKSTEPLGDERKELCVDDSDA